jgi:hypothetical protein
MTLIAANQSLDSEVLIDLIQIKTNECVFYQGFVNHSFIKPIFSAVLLLEISPKAFSIACGSRS